MYGLRGGYLALCLYLPLSAAWEYQSVEGNEGWVQDHNYFRCLHYAKPLIWDDKLAHKARIVAQHIQEVNMLSHSPSYDQIPPSGENLANGTATAPSWCNKRSNMFNQHCAVGAWYREYAQYWGCNPHQDWKSIHRLGHWTAMIWKGTNTMGCAISSSGHHFVCHYGNSKCDSTKDMCMIESRAQQPMGLPNFNIPQCKGDDCVACLATSESERRAREAFCRQAHLHVRTACNCFCTPDSCFYQNDPPHELPGRDPRKTYRTLRPPRIASSEPSEWDVRDGGWRETYTKGKQGRPSRHVPDPQYTPRLDKKPSRQMSTTTRIFSTTTTTTRTTTRTTTTTRATTRARPQSVRRVSSRTSPALEPTSRIDVAGVVARSLGESSSVDLSKAIEAFRKNKLRFARQLAAFLSIVQSFADRHMQMDQTYLTRITEEIFATTPQLCRIRLDRAGKHLKILGRKRQSGAVVGVGELLVELADAIRPPLVDCLWTLGAALTDSTKGHWYVFQAGLLCKMSPFIIALFNVLVRGYELQAVEGKEGWLQDHNYFRCLHHAPPLAWDDKLASMSKDYANVLARKNTLVHSRSYDLTPPHGENLAFGYGRAPDFCNHRSGTYNQHCPVISWYMEYEQLWKCRNGVEGWKRGGEPLDGLGHFTAMIWKGINVVGCGISDDKKYFVCKYGHTGCRSDKFQCAQYFDYRAPLGLPNVNVEDCRGTACLQCLDESSSRRQYCEAQGGGSASFHSDASLSPSAAREVVDLAEQEMGVNGVLRIRQAAAAFERNSNPAVRKFGKFLRAMHSNLQGVMR